MVPLFKAKEIKKTNMEERYCLKLFHRIDFLSLSLKTGSSVVPARITGRRRKKEKLETIVHCC